MEIYSAINKIMSEVGPVDKSKRNKDQGFNFRGIDDVMNSLSALLAKHGVFIVPEVLDATREERTTKSGSKLLYSILRIKFTFYAKDGSSVAAVVIGEGMDSGDKASNKAMSIGLKYAMLQVFCIATEEMADPDADSPEAGDKTDPKVEKLLADDKRIATLTESFNTAINALFPDPTKQAVIRETFNEAKGIEEKKAVYYRMRSRAEIDKMDGPGRVPFEDRYKTDKDLEKLFRDARAENDKSTF